MVRDYARPLSVAVLCHLLGISEEDEERLTEWSVWFFYLFSVIPSEEIRRQLDESLVEFRDYFRRAIEEKRRSPRDDLISAMITAGEAEAGLSDTEIADTCMLLFADGVENVDAAVGNAVAALLDHPNELARLRADPTLLPSAVDECLRFETPALFIGRVALAPLSIRGTSIPAQSAILLMLGSANRDPMQFTDPDRLDLGRRPNTHLSFGKGRHSCVGGRLVRLEMRIALGALLESLPEWIPVEGERHWEARLGHRWLSQLRLRTYRG